MQGSVGKRAYQFITIMPIKFSTKENLTVPKRQTDEIVESYLKLYKTKEIIFKEFISFYYKYSREFQILHLESVLDNLSLPGDNL